MIDVSKSTLDVDAYPTAKPVSFANDEAGRSDALAALRKLHPTLIVVEATGGLETADGGDARSGRPVDCRGQSTAGA